MTVFPSPKTSITEICIYSAYIKPSDNFNKAEKSCNYQRNKSCVHFLSDQASTELGRWAPPTITLRFPVTYFGDPARIPQEDDRKT
ncbi:hypothetical protein WN55_06997 [Dufourea novaeangliae]|uniref:Uncharacterized protein n=1 Tax=Dufourea novaeangliae TaxID=178035 RepID=A0A154PR80_DUFNO|nr:hypothetical protein WN55_06997 [Dufourea novaeangliae]